MYGHDAVRYAAARCRHGFGASPVDRAGIRTRKCLPLRSRAHGVLIQSKPHMRPQFSSKHNDRKTMKHLTLLLLLVAAAISSVPLSAQEQQRSDPALSMLEGNWTGVYENEGRAYPCACTSVWDLESAYLYSELSVWQDADRRTLFFSEKEFGRSSGENEHAVYIFSSTGVTRWGKRRCDSRAWSGALNDSDGLGETVTWEWRGPDAYVRTHVLQDQEGQILKKSTISLKRAATKRVSGK